MSSSQMLDYGGRYGPGLHGLPPPALRDLYTMPELVRYADTTHSTARAWLRGYQYRTIQGRREAQPVAGSRAEGDLRSFADLIEVAAITSARKANVPLQRLRTAIDAARAIYKWERPLLEERFKHDGRDLFVDDPGDGQPVNLSRWGQLAWAHIREVLQDLDYEAELAVRWWPRGRQEGILVDPSVSFGRPVVQPYGVSTIAIAERFRVGETMDELADDYQIPRALIEQAVRYEEPPAEEA